jgi:hypothetical protein
MAVLRCAPQSESDIAVEGGGTKIKISVIIFWLFARRNKA